MQSQDPELDDLLRDELGGEEPSDDAKDYARQLYEKYRLPEPAQPAEPAPEEEP
ncbi:hypothetical protein HNR23_000646 [Nocardiopsis mwathae]|uniref:Uncharacterized protein n=1 Tax=Nocardiopsis mwathae TaxID=1472723 RepID=A0A7X0D4B6_9ACTN|nr:hypothetical protein [Nocardiopsis mwathae]MBB6170586.1 hypothetical protein [Nocardiopsis mwathae]